MECQVCFSSKASVTCCKCPFSTCKACAKRVLEESINDAMCCSCKHPWDDTFLISNLSSSWFLGNYRKSRTRVTLERQQGMMAATMPLVETEKNKRKRAEKIKQLEAEVKRMKEQIREHKNEIYLLRRGVESHTELPKKNVARFRCAVPDCKGFVTHASPECAVCESATCLKCMCTKGPDHECKEEDVANAKEILKATVSCPSCAARIQKSQGCDQMFCVLCHTAFSYRTGEIVTRGIHNPHYYELQARLNRGNVRREPGDIPCGGFPNLYDTVLPRGQQTNHLGRIRICNHITGVELGNLRSAQDFNAQNRVKYILGDISEKTYLTNTNRLAMDEKVNTHYHDILRAFVDASQDVYARFRVAVQKPPGTRYGAAGPPRFDDSEFLRELDTIVQFTNEAAKKIGETYKRVYPVIPTEYSAIAYPNLEWVRPGAGKAKA